MNETKTFEEKYPHAAKLLRDWGKVEFFNGISWVKPSHAESFYALASLNNTLLFRTKPEKKRVPLTRDDLPAFFWIVFGDPETYPHFQSTRISRTGISVELTTYQFSELTQSEVAKWSTDRKAWHPFWKEVEE